jgi:hypothetical protein
MIMSQSSTKSLGRLLTQILVRLGQQSEAPSGVKAFGLSPSFLDWISTGTAQPATKIDINPGVVVSDHTVGVIRGILTDAGESSATITSGRRTVLEQANIMYRNLVATGVARQREIYATSGDSVIDTYEEAKRAGKSPDAIVSAMVAKINAIGPTRVSNHLNANCDTVDIATSSIENGNAFVAALQRAKDAGKIEGFLVEGKGMAYHVDVERRDV